MGIKLQPGGRGGRDIGTSLAEINVTPLVDVMLVLLIIFMVTAPLMHSGIGVNLPQAETDSAPADEGLEVTITADR
ncbi:MAG: biopolymer transporter ExbD, partial [Candidatus Aminicenantes bacterium]|nr:biopolymer transporter ExbD [Candidatus Aminicenantes bacterium]